MRPEVAEEGKGVDAVLAPRLQGRDRVARQGRELHARLSTLGSHASKLGRDLRRAVEDYNAMVASLETRVLVTGRQINRMDESKILGESLSLEAQPRTFTAPELTAGDAA